MSKPRVVLLVSGKRKCGKDYISTQLLSQYVCCYLLYTPIEASESKQFFVHFILLALVTIPQKLSEYLSRLSHTGQKKKASI